MDVIASVPSFDKVITKTVPTGLIDVEVTHEVWKHSKTVLATETDVLQAVKQDPAVLEAQVVRETIRPQRVDPSTGGGGYARLADPYTNNGPTPASHFERLAGQQWQALQSLAPEQLALLMRYVSTLRRQRHALQRTLECAFCKNNGESQAWYTQHALKDWRGRVLCPVLRAFRCPRCGATGDRAHTIKYCPENSEAGRWSPDF